VASVKLDENIPDSVRDVLRSAGHDVVTVAEEDLLGASDDAVLRAAASEGRLLVTLDLDFGDILTHPPQSAAGIVVLRPHRQTPTLVRELAASVAALLHQEPIRGRLWVIDEARLRIWPGGDPD